MCLILSKNLQRLLERESISLEKSGIDTGDINLSLVSDSDELISKLVNSNSLYANESRDKESIARYIELRKMGFRSMHYYFEGAGSNMDVSKASRYDGGAVISGEEHFTQEELKNRGKYDYRITMRGSSKTSTEEALAYVDSLIREANNRNLNLRMKDQWAHDAVILYVNQEELLATVKMLEDLKTDTSYGTLVQDAIKHFGPVMPFSATISKDSYYGIGMAHSEGQYGKTESKLRGFYGGNYGNTFGGYVEDICLEPTYDSLLAKYNGDASKITVDEMYNGAVNRHKMYMLGNTNENIPLWMNRRNYTDYKNMKRKSNEEMNGFRRATDFDLESSVQK
jgi:hypothetical protein